MEDIYIIVYFGIDNFILLGDGITVMATEIYTAMVTDIIVIGARLTTAQFMLGGILGITDTHITMAMEIDIMETIITDIMVITVDEV